MKRLFLCLVLCFVAFSNYSNAQKIKLITWDTLNQEVTISKNDIYDFKYRNELSSDWTYIEVKKVSGNDDLHTLIIRTHSVTPIDKSLPPDTVYIPCPGEGDPEFGYKGGEIVGKGIIKKPERTVVFTDFNQVEVVRFCESVTIVYESIDDGYYLHLKRSGERKTIEFKCLCQSFIVSNPESTSMVFDKNLRYEQIIWTPMENNLWEVRIGTTERKCKSRALDNIKQKRNSDYENKIPKCKNQK